MKLGKLCSAVRSRSVIMAVRSQIIGNSGIFLEADSPARFIGGILAACRVVMWL